MCLFNNIDPDTIRVWISTGNALPQLLPAKKVFTPSVPTLEELWEVTSAQGNSDNYDLFLDGQLIEEDKTKTRGQVDRRKLFSRSLLYACQSEIPPQVIKVFNIYNHQLNQEMLLPSGVGVTALESSDRELSINITPPTAKTNLHHGMYSAMTLFRILCGSH
jgi:hypothetical protein